MIDTCFAKASIEMAEFENKLFESMLKINYRKAEILKEADGEEPAEEVKADATAAESAVKENIFKKIGAKIKEFFTWLAGLFEKLAGKIRQIIMSNNAVIKKYEEAIKKDGALEGFEGIKNFSAPNVKIDIAKVNKLYTELEEMFDQGLWYSNDMEEKVSEIKKEAEVILDKPVESWTGNGFDWNKAFVDLKAYADGNTIFGAAISSAKKIAAKPDSIIMKIKNIKTKDSTFNQGLDADAKKAFSNIREGSQILLDANKKYFKALRQAIITCGTYALKKSSAKATDTNKEETKQEAADLAWAAGLQSEMYLDEQFAFI